LEFVLISSVSHSLAPPAFGGILLSAFGASDVIEPNLYSMIVAIIGAIGVLVIYHAIVRRTGCASFWPARTARYQGRTAQRNRPGGSRVSARTFGDPAYRVRAA
jgi:hypothetical protein